MTVYNPQRDTPPFLRECHQDTGPRRAPSEDVMHGPRLQSLPVAEWLALTQLNGATSPTAPTAPCTASTAPTAPTAPYAPVSPGLPDYRTAHRSSSSELRELESELREIELRVASLSADSGGGRRRDAGPPQSPQGKSVHIGIRYAMDGARQLCTHHTRTLCATHPAPCRTRASSLAPHSPRAPSAQDRPGERSALLAAAARDGGVGPVDPWEPANANVMRCTVEHTDVAPAGGTTTLGGGGVPVPVRQRKRER